MKMWCNLMEKQQPYSYFSTEAGVIMVSVFILDVVVCELFDDLTVDLIFQRFSLQRSFKDLVCQLID